ncbi:MAG: leucyl aminopeptidase, partial [Rhodobacterales bacterium]
MMFAAKGGDTLPLHLVASADCEAFLQTLSATERAWAEACGFRAGLGEVVLFPGESGVAKAAVGYGDETARARTRFGTAAARAHLPEGTYELISDLEGSALEEVLLGWLLAGYRFDRYAQSPAPRAMLVAPDGIDAERLEIIAAGETLTRDLINLPANDMGPEELAATASELAEYFGAALDVIVDDALLDGNFPMIHTVGRAAPRRPRLIDMRWGEKGPKLTLVGKGVSFDTGGLNLKPGASMALMKKDMGGGAAVLGLAYMIMALNLPLQLRVLIPAVENAVAGNAFRPGDILTSRKGLTVEINNTDAEGRLVLADALALADEDAPDLIISMATLTGAARVAVGADLSPFYATEPE